VRFIHAYLIVYFSLVTGAVLALWRARVLAHIAPAQVTGAVLIAIGCGVALAVWRDDKPK
jgi:hypothetical protein